MPWLKNLRLRSAARRGALEKIGALVSAGANVETRNPQGFSVLMLAAGGGQIDAVRLLIELGADVNRPAAIAWVHGKIEGVTPLMAACCDSTGRADVVRVLLDLGADAELRDSEGRSASDYARLSGYEEIVGLPELGGVVGPA